MKNRMILGVAAAFVVVNYVQTADSIQNNTGINQPIIPEFALEKEQTQSTQNILETEPETKDMNTLLLEKSAIIKE